MTREHRAQALVLQSVLANRPLPGMQEAVGFSEIEEDAELALVDDRDPSDFDLPPHVRLVSTADLATLAAEGRLLVLQFAEPEPFPGKVSVRLRLSVVLPEHGQVPLEELVTTFIDSDPLRADSSALLAV